MLLITIIMGALAIAGVSAGVGVSCKMQQSGTRFVLATGLGVIGVAAGLTGLILACMQYHYLGLVYMPLVFFPAFALSDALNDPKGPPSEMSPGECLVDAAGLLSLFPAWFGIGVFTVILAAGALHHPFGLARPQQFVVFYGSIAAIILALAAGEYAVENRSSFKWSGFLRLALPAVALIGVDLLLFASHL